MNEFFSNPFYMFLLLLGVTIAIGVTIGSVIGHFLSRRKSEEWISDQSSRVDQNIKTWNDHLKPIVSHVENLNQTCGNFNKTEKRYEQLANNFQDHETGIKNHLSKADAILNTYQRTLNKKDQDERLDATDMKNQLQQLRHLTSDITNHHKYNSLVEKLPALKSEKFEEISNGFFEMNVQLENFKNTLKQEEHDALLDQWKVFGDLVAAMIECISKIFTAECTKAIDPSRTQQMDKKLQEASQEFTEKTDKFVDEMATAQNQLQDYHAERLKQQEQQAQRAEKYSQSQGQSRSR